jgi:hypothetical protein
MKREIEERMELFLQETRDEMSGASTMDSVFYCYYVKGRGYIALYCSPYPYYWLPITSFRVIIIPTVTVFVDRG